MWLYISISASKKFHRAVAGKVFYYIYMFTASIITFPWITFCIFVGQRASHCCHNCFADKIFRSNQFNIFPLPSRLVFNCLCNLRIKFFHFFK